MKRLSYIFLFFTFHFSLFTSCNNDEATKTYSTANMVRCYLQVNQYTQLFNVMGSMGEYATIRPLKSDGKLLIWSNIGSTEYPIAADMKGYEYGLGGLIVGVNYYNEYMAFDLSCPNCNRAGRRLSISYDGIAKCGKCGISYDLNNYGVLREVPTDCSYETPRGLFRYRIIYDGSILGIYN